MSKLIMIGLILLFVGCVSKPSPTISIVKHNNSLDEAYEYCKVDCRKYAEGYWKYGGFRAELKDCTDMECMCTC